MEVRVRIQARVVERVEQQHAARAAALLQHEAARIGAARRRERARPRHEQRDVLDAAEARLGPDFAEERVPERRVDLSDEA